MNFPNIPLPIMPPDFALADLLSDTCTLYRPSPIASTPGNFEAADASYVVAPTYTGIRCHYEPTPEFDEPENQGVTKQVNILTSDKFTFLSSQEVADQWLILLTTPGHAYNGRIWVIQGNSFMNDSEPGRYTSSQWLYAKLSPTQLIPMG